MKPLIGITCGIGTVIKNPASAHLPQEYHQLADSYVRAVERAGGVPLIIPIYSDAALVREAIARVDGVILSGGGDIDPARFGQRITCRSGAILPRRDAVDIETARYVIEETEKPLLGVCRGIQAINVAMGGELYQDLEAAGKLNHQLTMYPRAACSHEVDVLPGSRLADILGAGMVGVNSLHHQAIHKPAPGCLVSARSVPDEVIEAIEFYGERFIVAVQWHPEALADKPNHQALFRRLVAAAGAR